MKRQQQRGIYLVEFAIIGSLFFIVLFAVIETGRVFYTLNALNEVTRRGARVAAVCPVEHSGIRQVALFNAPTDTEGSAIISNLTAANINLEYLDASGNPVANIDDIQFVRTSIVDYQITLLIPFPVPITINAPAFTTTRMRESLGASIDPFTGDVVTGCF